MISRGNLIIICSNYKHAMGIEVGLRISEMNFCKRKQDKIILGKVFTAKAVTLFLKRLLLKSDLQTEKHNVVGLRLDEFSH